VRKMIEHVVEFIGNVGERGDLGNELFEEIVQEFGAPEDMEFHEVFEDERVQRALRSYVREICNGLMNTR